MQERLRIAFTAGGMLPRPRTLRQWRQEVEEKCAQLYDQLIVDDACLMELDLMHGARTCRELEDWPIASLVGGSRLMHTYGELIGYTGPIWLRQERFDWSHGAQMVSFLYETVMEAVLRVEPAVRRMPWPVRLRKLNEAFVRSRIPMELQKSLNSQADLYNDVSTRVVLWEASSPEVVARLLSARMPQIMELSKFEIICDFAGDAPHNSLLHRELQRLTGVAAYRALGKTSEAARKVVPHHACAVID
jgi:hypothetical protein